MSEKNLPIKLVLQKTSDTQKNQGGGGIKYFCEVTKELQDVMTEKFEGVLSYYESVFQESELIPAVGKITVKPLLNPINRMTFAEIVQSSEAKI